MSFFVVLRIVLFFFSLQFIRDAFFRWDGYSYYMTFMDFLPHLSLSYILWTIQGIIIAVVFWILTYGLHRLNHTVFSALNFDCVMFWFCLLSIVVFGISIFFKLTVSQLVVSALHQKILLLVFGVFMLIIFWLAEKYIDHKTLLLGFVERITPLLWCAAAMLLLAVPLSVVTFNASGKLEEEGQGLSAVQSDRGGPNVIVVVMDSLTARDMQLYGYERPTTPFLKKWSKDAIVFNRAYSQANWTTPATMSILTGQRPWTHRLWYQAERHFNDKYEQNIVQVLHNHGYETYSFVQNKYGHPETLGIGDAFLVNDEARSFWVSPNKAIEKLTDFFMNRPIVGEWMVENNPLIRPLNLKLFRKPVHNNVIRPEAVYDRFLEYISLHKNAPFFAWIHMYPPHELYLPTEPYMGMFGSEKKFDTAEKQIKSNLLYSYYKPERQADVDVLRKRYDEFIRDCDQQFELFLNHLNKTVDMSNTIIIVTSDHGESFSRGYQGHNGPDLYESLVHIPLIIKVPDKSLVVRRNEDNNRIDIFVEQIDIAPTILDFSGIPLPAWMEGRSLVPLMNGEMIESRPVWSMQLENNRSLGKYPIEKGTIAVWDGDYKLIFNIEKRKSRLFNIRKDPDELKNLIDEERDTGNRLLALIEDKLAEVNERIFIKGDQLL